MSSYSLEQWKSQETKLQNLNQDLVLVSIAFNEIQRGFVKFRKQYTERLEKQLIQYFQTLPATKSLKWNSSLSTWTDTAMNKTMMKQHQVPLFVPDEMSQPVQVVYKDSNDYPFYYNLTRSNGSLVLVQELEFKLDDVAVMQFEPKSVPKIPNWTIFVNGHPLVALRRERFVNVYDLLSNVANETYSIVKDGQTLSCQVFPNADSDLYLYQTQHYFSTWLDPRRTMHLSFADLVGMGVIHSDRLDWYAKPIQKYTPVNDSVVIGNSSLFALAIVTTQEDVDLGSFAKLLLDSLESRIFQKNTLFEKLKIDNEQDLFAKEPNLPRTPFEPDECLLPKTQDDCMQVTTRCMKQRKIDRLVDNQFKQDYPSARARLTIQSVLVNLEYPWQDKTVHLNSISPEHTRWIQNARLKFHVNQQQLNTLLATHTPYSTQVRFINDHLTSAIWQVATTSAENLIVIHQISGHSMHERLKQPNFPVSEEDRLLYSSGILQCLTQGKICPFFQYPEEYQGSATVVIDTPEIPIVRRDEKDKKSQWVENPLFVSMLSLAIPLPEQDRQQTLVWERLYTALYWAAMHRAKHIVLDAFGLEFGYSGYDMADKINRILSSNPFYGVFETITFANPNGPETEPVSESKVESSTESKAETETEWARFKNNVVLSPKLQVDSVVEPPRTESTTSVSTETKEQEEQTESKTSGGVPDAPPWELPSSEQTTTASTTTVPKSDLQTKINLLQIQTPKPQSKFLEAIRGGVKLKSTKQPASTELKTTSIDSKQASNDIKQNPRFEDVKSVSKSSEFPQMSFVTTAAMKTEVLKKIRRLGIETSREPLEQVIDKSTFLNQNVEQRQTMGQPSYNFRYIQASDFKLCPRDTLVIGDALIVEMTEERFATIWDLKGSNDFNYVPILVNDKPISIFIDEKKKNMPLHLAHLKGIGFLDAVNIVTRTTAIKPNSDVLSVFQPEAQKWLTLEVSTANSKYTLTLDYFNVEKSKQRIFIGAPILDLKSDSYVWISKNANQFITNLSNWYQENQDLWTQRIQTPWTPLHPTIKYQEYNLLASKMLTRRGVIADEEEEESNKEEEDWDTND